MDCRGHLDRLSHPDPCEPFTTVKTPTIRLPLLIYVACLLRFPQDANGWTHTNYSQINNRHADQMKYFKRIRVEHSVTRRRILGSDARVQG
jgi:hypothetical protein